MQHTMVAGLIIYTTYQPCGYKPFPTIKLLG